MFEHGVTTVRADFHLHTKQDKEFKYTGEDNSFVNDYVSALKNQRIQVGVITNHNKFDLNEYKALRKKARKEGILLLPGVELSVKEGANGVHTLIVFDPEAWLQDGENHIETFLSLAFAGIPNRENENTRCTLDFPGVLTSLDQYGRDYFIIFAHVDSNSGLLKECGGGLIKSLAQNPGFKKRVLAMQKMHSLDNARNFEQWANHKLPNVEGSDPKTIDQIGKGQKTYLKVGAHTFSAVKYALQDYQNRIVEEADSLSHGYIRSAAFIGGLLDGITLDFSSGLNTLIGIRGSGKSSILEVIRYALTIDPQADVSYKNELVKNVLGSGGQIELNVIDRYGHEFRIRRILNESPSVFDEGGNIVAVPARSILSNPLYFGQKDLSQATDYEFELLKRLVGARVEKTDDRLSELNRKICDTVGQLLDLASIPKQIIETQEVVDELTFKLTVYQERGVADKLSKQTSCDQDRQKIDYAQKQVAKFGKDLKKLYTQFDIAKISLSSYGSVYNQDIVDQATVVLAQLNDCLGTIASCITQVDTLAKALESIIEKLDDRVDSLKEEFAAIKREIKDETIDPDNFVQMFSQLGEMSQKIDDLKSKGNSKKSVETILKQHIIERNELLLSIYRAYVEEATKINTTQSELHIDITFKGQKETFKEELKRRLRGTGITDAKYQQMSEKFSDFVAIIEDWLLGDGAQLRQILSDNEYVKLTEKLEKSYSELVEIQTDDRVDIMYHGKLLKKHSLGQRASALILFILTQNDNDVLIVDQPEDDLDNKVIYDEVIQAIKKRKPDIQFVFATHNANIPVLGDAEKVISASFSDDAIVINQGNIDMSETHQQIVDIMEGGQEAFDRRRMIYSAWGSR